MGDFIPSELLKRMMHWWWLLILLMLAGGSAGVFIAQLQKPVFESQASITTSIDFAYAGRLSEDEEDYLIATIGDLIDSSQVLNAVQQTAAKQEIIISEEDLGTRFTKARQGYRWELTVRDHNPEIAQILAQFWVDQAGEEVAALRQRSIDSLLYQTAQLALQDCFSQTVVLEPVSANCSLEQISEIRNALSETVVQGKVYSQPNAILLSKISAEVTEFANFPANPVVYNRNLCALAGCFCGFLIGLGFLLFGKQKPL